MQVFLKKASARLMALGVWDALPKKKHFMYSVTGG